MCSKTIWLFIRIWIGNIFDAVRATCSKMSRRAILLPCIPLSSCNVINIVLWTPYKLDENLKVNKVIQYDRRRASVNGNGELQRRISLNICRHTVECTRTWQIFRYLLRASLVHEENCCFVIEARILLVGKLSLYHELHFTRYLLRKLISTLNLRLTSIIRVSR